MRVAPFAAGVLAVALSGACGDDDSESTAPVLTEPEVTVSSPTSEPPPPSTLPPSITTPATEPTTEPATEPPTTPSPTTAPTPPTSAPAPETSTPGAGSLPESVQARVDAAIADLAGRQGVAASAITVVDAREVTWPDSSLGCPEPGMSYMQVLTSGFLLVLEVNGVQYEYHGGTSGDLVYCERPRPPVSGVGST
jgi:hypothetical protein